MKYQSRENGCYNRVALEFDSHLGNAATEVPVKFESNCKSRNPNLAASRDFTKSGGKTPVRLVNRGLEEYRHMNCMEPLRNEIYLRQHKLLQNRVGYSGYF